MNVNTCELPYLKHCCKQCALPLPSINIQALCGDCFKGPIIYAYRILSTFLYQFPIGRLITTFKFEDPLSISRILARLMDIHMQKAYEDNHLPDVVIPMTLHTARLKGKRFNQALELAKSIAQVLAISINYHSCIPIRNTKLQMGLSSKVCLFNRCCSDYRV